MNRADFLKNLGVAALITATGLPSFAEVEQHIAKVDGYGDTDPFWHIRKLMKEAAQPDWEYHFRQYGERDRFDISKINLRYDVWLLQNDNHHRESWYMGPNQKFGEQEQLWMFDRLMYGVTLWNAQPEEKRKIVQEFMRGQRLSDQLI